MRSFAGSSAINCGRLPRTASDEEMQAGLSCALNAAGRGLGFTLSREYQGIDSFVAEGLMARAGDTIFKFLFDGGLGSGNGSFSTQPCPQPFLASPSGRTVFACR
jgi:hypothetical protein